MAQTDNRGFAAVVAAVSDLRASTEGLNKRQLALGRQRYNAQLDTVKATEKTGQAIADQTTEIKKGQRVNRDPNTGRFISQAVEPRPLPSKDNQGRFIASNQNWFQQILANRMTDDEALKAAEKIAAEQRKRTDPPLFQRVIQNRMTDDEALKAAEKMAAEQRRLGQSANQGFLQGLGEDSPGKKFGKKVVSDIETELEIQSPSRKARRLARDFVAGWNLEIDGLWNSTNAQLSNPPKSSGSGSNWERIGDRLAKSLVRELQARPLKVETKQSWGQSLQQGLFYGIGDRLVGGFDRARKETVGFSNEDIGYGVGTLVSDPIKALRETVKLRRKWQVSNKALELAQKIASEESVENDDGKELIFTVGGLVGNRGRGGQLVAKSIKHKVDKNLVKVIPVNNPNTDNYVRDDQEKLLDQVLSVINTQGGNVDKQSALKSVRDYNLLSSQINHGLIQGYNMDAVRLAAKVISARRQNPNTKISLVGHSAGGQVVEEALAILEKAGITDIKGMGLGTPNIGIGLDAQNYQGFVGEKDIVRKGALLPLEKPNVSQKNTDLRNEDIPLDDHSLDAYLSHSVVSKALFGGIPKEISESIRRDIDEINNVVAEALNIDLSSDNNQVKARLDKLRGLSDPAFEWIDRHLATVERFGEDGEPFKKELLSARQNAQKAFSRLITPPNENKSAISENILSPLSGVIQELKAAIESLTEELRSKPEKATEARLLSVADQYQVRLSRLMKEAKQGAGQSVTALIPDFKSLTIQEKRDRAGDYNKGLQAQIKAYRQAVKDGDRQLVMELGERILVDSQSVAKIYDDILTEVPGDYAGTKALQVQRNQVTRIQNEVLKGDRGAGRSRLGLAEMVGDAENLAGAGDKAAQRLIDSIRDKFKDGVKELESEFDRPFEAFSVGLEEDGKDAGDSFANGLKSAFNALLDWLEKVPLLGKLVTWGRGAVNAIGQFLRPGEQSQKSQPQKPERLKTKLEQLQDEGHQVIQRFVDDLENIQNPLEEFENRIRNFPIELGGIFDPSGKFVKGFVGGQMGVEIPGQDVPLLEGNIFTHNHPSYKTYNRGDGHIELLMPTNDQFDYDATQRPVLPGGSFSTLDTNLATVGKVSEIRAVSSTHNYSLKAGEQTIDPASNQVFTQAYQEFFDFWQNVRVQALNEFAQSYEDAFRKEDEVNPIKNAEPLINRAILAQLDIETLTHNLGIHYMTTHAAKQAGYKYRSQPLDPAKRGTGLSVASWLDKEFPDLDKVGRDFAHRVVSSIEEYIGLTKDGKPFEAFSVGLEEAGENAGSSFVSGLESTISEARAVVSEQMEAILEEIRMAAPLDSNEISGFVKKLQSGIKKGFLPNDYDARFLTRVGVAKKIGFGLHSDVYQVGNTAIKYGKIDESELRSANLSSQIGLAPRLFNYRKREESFDPDILSMEKLSGKTLNARYLDKGKQIPPDVYEQIISAQRRLSMRGLVHGDLHGGNVIYTPKKGVRLIDYGGSAVNDKERLIDDFIDDFSDRGYLKQQVKESSVKDRGSIASRNVESKKTELMKASLADVKKYLDVQYAYILGETETLGDNITDSLIKAVEVQLSELKGAGAAIGEALKEGTEESLKIESPSKVYKAIGEHIIKGLEGGLDGFDGTLEEKRALLDTYVKSVIELVYDFPKVIGKPTTEIQRIRKLFQDIGATGQASQKQLEQAAKYFPQLEKMPEGKAGVAVYQPKRNVIQVNPDREGLPEDLMHEYTHAVQNRFGLGSRFAQTPSDFFRYLKVLSRRGQVAVNDPRIARGADRSASAAVQGYGITPEQGARYSIHYNHMVRAETEAYANELGIGQERKRRGFFKAEAEEMAAQIKAAKKAAREAKQAVTEQITEVKEAIAEQVQPVKEASQQIGEAVAEGTTQGKKFAVSAFTAFLNWLEGIPVLGTLVKWGRQLYGAIAGLFNKPKPPVAEPTPKQKQTVSQPVTPVEKLPDTNETVLVTAPPQAPPQKANPADYGIWDDEEKAVKKRRVIKARRVKPVKPAEPTQPPAQAIEVKELSPKQLADQYLAYLHQWAAKLGTDLDTAVKAKIQEWKGSGVNVAQSLRAEIDQAFEGFEQRKTEFRQAIADGQNELAKSLGVDLVERSERLRVLYQNMSKNVRMFEKGGGPNFWRDQASEMTKVQREAMKGYPNLKGRAKTGTYQAIAGSKTEGFLQIIQEEIKQAEKAGFDLGEAAIRGVKKALKLSDQDVSAFKVDLLDLGLNVVGTVAEDKSDGIIGKGLQKVRQFFEQLDQSASQGLHSVQDKVKNFFDDINAKFEWLGKGKDLIIGFFAAFLAESILVNAISLISRFASESAEVVYQFENLSIAFRSVSGSSQKAAQNMKFVRDEAQRLGLDLNTAREAHARLLAVTQGTAIAGGQTERLFSVFSETASLRGLNAEEQSRMFQAVQQMLAKKKVSAEEVRGQLGEIAALNFQNTLARALGINAAQLDEAMSSGLLNAEDVLPKVAAQYAAENAAIADSSDTTQKALTRYNNSIQELREGFAAWVAGMRPIYNFLAEAIAWFAEAIPSLLKWIGALTLSLGFSAAGGLMKALIKSETAMAILRSGIGLLKVTIIELIKAIGPLLVKSALFYLMFESWEAIANTFKNRHQDIVDGNLKAAKSAEAFAAAIRDLNKASKDYKPPELPKNADEIINNETWKVFGRDTKTNLEKGDIWRNMVVPFPLRVLGNWLLPDDLKKQLEKFDSPRELFGRLSNAGRRAVGLPEGFVTQGQKNLNDYIESVSQLSLQANQTISTWDAEARRRVAEMLDLDRQLNASRSRQMLNMPGDRQAYEKSKKEQELLLSKREELNKAIAAQQQTLEDDIATAKLSLARLDELVSTKQITQDEYVNQKRILDQTLSGLTKTKNSFEELTSTIVKQVNALERAVRNLNEQSQAFKENLERTTQLAQARIYRQALTSGEGSQVVSLRAEQSNLGQQRQLLDSNQSQIAQLYQYLQNPEFAPVYANLQQQMAEQGLTLESSATLQRLLEERGNLGDGGVEKSVIATLQQIVTLKNESASQQSQLAQGIFNFRSNLKEIDKSVSDWFFNLNQQIKEAQNELKRQLDSLRYGKLKQLLQRSLIPGANTFVDGIVSGLQGLIDQAAQISEKILGQNSAQFAFEGEQRSLQYELNSFVSGLNGANDALKLFREWLTKFSNFPIGVPGSPNPSQPVQPQSTQPTGRNVAVGNFGQNTVMSLAGEYGLRKNQAKGNHFGSLRSGSKTHHGSGNAVDFGDREQGVSVRQAHKKFSDYVKQLINDGMAGYVEEVIWNGHGSPLGDWFATKGKGPFYKLKNGKKEPIGNALAYGHTDHLHIAETTRGGDPYVTRSQTATPVSNKSQYGTPAQRQAIANFIKRYPGSPLTVDDVINAHLKSGVAIDFILAQAALESGLGTTGRGKTTRNPLNYGNDDLGNNRSFGSYGEGLTSGAIAVGRDYAKSFDEFDLAGMRRRDKRGYYAADPSNIHLPNQTYLAKMRNLMALAHSVGVPNQLDSVISPTVAGGTQGTQVMNPQPAKAVTPVVETSKVSQDIQKTATQLTDQLLKSKEGKIKLNAQEVLQQISELQDGIVNFLTLTTRQIRDTREQTQRTNTDLKNQFLDLQQSFTIPTAKTEQSKARRDALTQINNFDVQLEQRRRELTDSIESINRVQENFTKVIGAMKDFAQQKRKEGTVNAVNAANAIDSVAGTIQATLQKATNQLPGYQKALKEIIALQAQVKATKQQALNFVDTQAEIKALEDEIQLLDKQGAIAQQRNDFEAERQANLAKIRKQQELDTKNTQGRFADDPQNLKRQLEAINQKAELDAQAVNDTYRDRLLQIRQELVGKIGEINDLTGNLEDKLQSDIEKINAEEQSAINEAETKYRNDPAQQKELVDLAKQRAEWSRKMVENAYQEQVLSREIETIQLRMAVAQQQNNYQEIERLKLLEAQAQYQQELLNLSKKFATEPEKALEQQNLLQEKLLETNRLIRLDTEAALLGRQKNLADLQSQLAQAQIEAMQRRGLDIESRPLAVSDQKRQERLRYQQQVIDIKRNPNPYEVEEQLAIAAQINQLNIERIDSQFKGLGETITDLGRNGLADFFTNTISGTKNLSDAFGEMAQSILKSLANMMAQLATVELFKLLGLSTAGLSGSQIPGFGTLFGGGEAAPVSGNFSTERLSPFSGGNALDLAGGFTGILNTVLGFAEGGYTGDGGKWEPKGIVHGGEFVMTQWATKQVGIDLLAAINKTGRVPVMAVPPSSGPSMAPLPAPSKTVIINQNFTDQRDRYLTQNRTLLQDAVYRGMK